MKAKKTPRPNKEQIATFIRDAGGDVGKREIARAFSITGADRAYLKDVLRELAAEGVVRKGAKRQFADPKVLPTITVIEVFDTDDQGELLAKPVTKADWDIAKTVSDDPPLIRVERTPRIRPAVGVGDRLLARLEPTSPHVYTARPIRRISHGTECLLGIIEAAGDGFILRSTDRKASGEFAVRTDDLGRAKVGDLVTAEILPRRGGRFGARQARVIERLGSRTEPKAFSLIALHANDIPYIFTDEAVGQAKQAQPVTALGKRTDLRKIPLVTIDGEDARDFDDAVFAEPDDDPTNLGGWHLIVAIADVAHYVRPGDALDRTAKDRGNSVYFPDRVVPMLPEELSNNLCSLRPNEDRPCLVAHMWVDAEGRKRRHRFERALMRSAARLTYTQVQTAQDGHPDDTTGPLLDPVIAPLYGAYAALNRARIARGTLDLDIPEKKIMVDEAGHVTGVSVRERFDSHRLIEEFMILANVAAAEALEAAHQPVMYRVHDEPSLEKLEALRTTLATVNIKLARGQVMMPRNFMQILNKAEGLPQREMIHQMVLRTQAQAQYDPANIGHFGLALRRYAHFTSPIRRYADLLIHRALITGFSLGEGGLPPDTIATFSDVAEHISMAERRAAKAEREVVDRYAALYLQDRVGADFAGRIAGVSRFGLFVTLAETGADGLIPISTLPSDFYRHDEARNRLVGQRNNRVFALGDALTVRLMEANPLTGSLLLALPETANQPRSNKPQRIPRPKHRR
ncbi:MAG: ribonuclease R [Rhodospirillaceae bacterium]|nr:ribonuclease R [Rhodospirillaceae bacterium]